jgi:hypothetical protein
LIGQQLSIPQEEYTRLDENEDELLPAPVTRNAVTRSSESNPGIILGIHNVYICIPQFISTIISALTFLIFKEDSFGWAISVGSIASVVAGFYALRAQDDVNTKDE